MLKIKEKLDQIFYLVFKLSPKKNKSKLNYNNVKNWDSLNHVKLILAIESMFKIKIEPKDTMDLLSYQKIIKYLKKNV